VPAQLEKAVLAAGLLHSQDLAPEQGQGALDGGAGRRGGGGRADRLRLRQRRAVHLAVAVERHAVEEHERGRNHVLGQLGPQEPAQLRRQTARQLARQRVVGEGAPGEIGRRRHGAGRGGKPRAPPRTQNGAKTEGGIRIGRQLDVVAVAIAERPERLGIDPGGDPRRDLPAQLGEGRDLRPGRGEEVEGGGFGREPRVGESGELQRAGLPREEPFDPGERQPPVLPVDAATRRSRGRLAHAQHHVVAEAGQLVVRAPPFDQDLDPADGGQAPGQGEEEPWIHRQLLLVRQPVADPAPQLGNGHRVRSAGQLDRRVERLEQGEAAQIAEEDRASRRHRPHRPFQHPHQVVGARKVLDDRVEDGEIEALALGGRDARRLVGHRLPQLHLGQLAAGRREPAANAVQGPGREVGPQVSIGARGDPEEQEAGAAADLQDPAGA
jgi:hypothetical protein